MTIYYILKPFDYPAESIVTTPFFPLEDSPFRSSEARFWPISWPNRRNKPQSHPRCSGQAADTIHRVHEKAVFYGRTLVPDLNVHEYARFHDRDEVLVGEHNPRSLISKFVCPPEPPFLWTDAIISPSYPQKCLFSWI